jgi:Tol biopolymer transport system component
VLTLQLDWCDRAGRCVDVLGEPAVLQAPPRAAPDRRIAATVGPLGAEDIWVYDTAGHGTRLTFDRASDNTPLWSGDGRHIVFQSNRATGRTGFYQTSAKGGAETVLFECPAICELQDLSADGRFIVFSQAGPSRDRDLWVLPLAGSRQPFLYFHADADQNQAQISPDGRWLAYTSNETGRNEIYVQTFPHAGKRLQVSIRGGVQARWRRDRSEIFFLELDGMLVAVPLHDDVEAGMAAPLFRTSLPTWGAGSLGWRTSYDVAPDGRSLLLLKPLDHPTPISVTLNWPATLRK